MAKRLLGLLRGNRPVEELHLESDFVELVIAKSAKRRGVRPDQVRLSLMMESFSEDAMSGAGTDIETESGGLH